MVRGEKASAIWGALRVGEGLSGLVLIGWRLVPKEPPIYRSSSGLRFPTDKSAEVNIADHALKSA